MTAKTMKAFVEQLRSESPELDQRIRSSRRREKLAVALHGLRTAANLTQKQLAERMGKDQAHVSRMESVTGPLPDSNSINAYARACGGSAGYVFVSAATGHDNVIAVSLDEDEDDGLVEAMHAHNVDVAE